MFYYIMAICTAYLFTKAVMAIVDKIEGGK